MKLRTAIKRIMALGIGATMVGATIVGAMGAADLANYPAPFVQNGMFNAYIVLGENGQTSDVIGAVEIATSLQVASRTATTITSTGGNNVAISQGTQISTASQPLRLGMNFSSTGRSTLTSADLGLLKDTSFQDEQGTAYTAQMKINLPPAFVAYGRSTPSSDQNVDQPVLYVDFDTGTPQYTMVIDFPTPVDPTNLTNDVIDLFGKEYTTGSAADMSASKITLFSSSVDQTFTAGQESVVDVNGQKVTVRVIGVNTQSSTPTATISVNGDTDTLTKGQTKTLGGQQIYVRDVQAYTQPVGGGGARLFIGSNKLVLEDGNNVETGTSATAVDGTNVTITQSDGKISRIAIGVRPRDYNSQDGVLLQGQDFVDPVFGTFKWVFANPGANPALMASSKSHVSLTPSEDRLTLAFKNKGGESYNLDIAKGNGTQTGPTSTVSYGNELLMRANGDVTKNLVTAPNSDIYRNDYFVIGSTNNEYQRVLKLTSLRNTSSATSITVQDVASNGGSQDWSWDPSTATGQMTYDGNTYNFNVVMTGTNDGYITTADTTNQIYTDNDNLITLPVNNAAHSGDVLNSGDDGTGNITTFNVTVQEHTGFSTGAKADDYGTISLRYAYHNGQSGQDTYLYADPTYTRTATGNALSAGDNGLGFTSFNFESTGSSSTQKSDLTPWGTYVEYNSDSSSQQVDLYMPSEQQSFNVFVAPVSAQVSSVGSTEGTQVVYQTNPINVGAAVLPSEISDINSVNAIVVGGPCVNSAAAELLGNPTNCAQGFEDGKGVLRLFEHPNGKVSLLVAGYSAQDTRRAARVLAQYQQYQASGKLQGTDVEVSGVKADFTDTVVSAPTVAPSTTTGNSTAAATTTTTGTTTTGNSTA